MDRPEPAPLTSPELTRQADSSYALYTPVGSDVTQELSSTTGATVVGLTFENVAQAGTTTISEATAGPNPPANFAIFRSTGVNGNTGQFYYDITTTAVFSGKVQVCLTYDETN